MKSFARDSAGRNSSYPGIRRDQGRGKYLPDRAALQQIAVSVMQKRPLLLAPNTNDGEILRRGVLFLLEDSSLSPILGDNNTLYFYQFSFLFE
jgi:hypothetical protein